MPTTSELACSTATKTLARPSRMVIVCVMSVPHISLTLSVTIVPSCGLVSVRPTRCGASRPFSRITRRTRRGLADMLCQFRVRACAAWARTTAARIRRHLLARAIDAGARDLPHPRDAHHSVTATQGGRAYLAHRLDLLWAKGRLPC